MQLRTATTSPAGPGAQPHRAGHRFQSSGLTRRPGHWPDPATSRPSSQPSGSCQVTATGPTSSGCGSSSQWWWQVGQEEAGEHGGSGCSCGEVGPSEGQHRDLPTVLPGPKTPKLCCHMEAQPGPPLNGTSDNGVLWEGGCSGREGGTQERGSCRARDVLGGGNTSAPQHRPDHLQPGASRRRGGWLTPLVRGFLGGLPTQDSEGLWAQAEASPGGRRNRAGPCEPTPPAPWPGRLWAPRLQAQAPPRCRRGAR